MDCLRERIVELLAKLKAAGIDADAPAADVLSDDTDDEPYALSWTGSDTTGWTAVVSDELAYEVRRLSPKSAAAQANYDERMGGAA